MGATRLWLNIHVKELKWKINKNEDSVLYYCKNILFYFSRLRKVGLRIIDNPSISHIDRTRTRIIMD